MATVVATTSYARVLEITGDEIERGAQRRQMYISKQHDVAWHRFVTLLFTEVLCWKRHVHSDWYLEFVFRICFGREIYFEYEHL